MDRGDQACDATPVQARLVLVNATTQVVITNVDTDSRGRFTVALEAGTYLIRPIVVNGRPARRPVATKINVTVGKYVSVTLRINNGLQ